MLCPRFALILAAASATLVACGSTAAAPPTDAAGEVGAADADATTTVAPCNGAVELCDRRLDQVALPGAHNAMSNFDEGWNFANQQHGMLTQLDDGIRAFLIDAHPADENTPDQPAGKAMLCHSLCQLGYEPLDHAFAKMKAWLDAHPREVIIYVIEDYVPEQAITDALTTSGMLPMCLHQPRDQPFPTLQALIAANTRVFIMLESGGGPAPWHHGYEDYAQDNPYSAETVADFSCNRLRGKAGNPLLLINHFLTSGLTGHELLANQANVEPGLSEHVLKCQTQFGQLPNIVALDWYHVGGLMPLVRKLNGLP